MDIPASWRLLQQQENKKVVLHNLRTLSLIAMTLVPACSLLDYFSYTVHFRLFFGVRALAALVEIALLALSYTSLGNKHYRVLMLLVPLVPIVTISWMIYWLGDPSSPYYAGLCLCLVGVGFLYQWSYLESLIAVVLTLACYACATLPLLHNVGVDKLKFGEFMNNGIFLLANCFIIVTGSLVHQRIRENEIFSRYTLAENRKELEQKNRQLVEMDRMKTDFFSNITHELRTPLTLMIAPLQRLQRQHPVEQNATSGLACEIAGIYQNSLRLLKLINDLLDLSSVDGGRVNLHRENFSLGEFTSGLFTSVASMAQHGGVTTTLRYESAIDLVESDQEKLEKILLNLIFNAVKFTPFGGSVAMVVEDKVGQMVFEVIDTGVGISQQHLPFIFDRFWQADSSSTRRHAGTGLGLALVKEMVGQFGGTLEAESELGRGTTIRVSLPLVYQDHAVFLGTDRFIKEDGHMGDTALAAPEMEQSAVDGDETKSKASSTAAWIKSVYREAEQSHSMIAQQVSGLAGNAHVSDEKEHHMRANLPLVLIVDDDPGLLRFMSSELEPNYRILKASSGTQALELTAIHRPDLVISDYMMPGLDGLALCRELRERSESKLMPIMLVTARSDDEVHLNALRHGANDILTKPFSLTKFHSRVHNLVQASLLRKEIERRNAELERAIDELRTTERELIQSEKMVALGILTGGIMHEINNPLNFARSALYILNRQAAKLPVEARADIQEIATDMGECINRIATIVSDLRIFCHPETAMTSTCQISDPLQSALRILAVPIKEGKIEIRDDVPPECGAVRGDRNQLTLVFINIIKNAIDALNGHFVSDGLRPVVRIQASVDAGEMELRIRDNGPGISQGNLARIFDPFFTTKAPGEGTGLGLALCYRIVVAHGGAIIANSEPQQGVEFIIRLPLADVVEERDVTLVQNKVEDSAPALAS